MSDPDSENALVRQLYGWANEIEVDGTPSQIGPTAEELRQVARHIDTLESRFKSMHQPLIPDGSYTPVKPRRYRWHQQVQPK